MYIKIKISKKSKKISNPLKKIKKKYLPLKKINKKSPPPQKFSKNVSKQVYLLTYGNAKSLFE